MKPTQSDTDTPKLVAAFTVDGEPVSKSRARFTKRGSKTFAYTPEKTKAGEERVAWTYRSAVKGSPTDPEIAYRVEAHFFNGTRQRRDVDNMVKLILDGLNGVAWIDDNQVTQIEARKCYVVRSEARTEVRVFEVGRLEPPKQPCLRCGREFRTYASWRDDPAGRKYCSQECARAHRVERKGRTCEECGEPFLAWGETRETRFCSRACADESRRAEVDCDGCGETFTKQRCHVRKRNYCSTECQQESAKKRRSKHYPGTCQSCGAGTTRKEYTRCNACRLAGAPSGKPRTIEEMPQ